MKIVGGDTLCSYYMLYQYFKISKIRQNFKNDPIAKKSTSRVANLVGNTCAKFESNPFKTVGGDRF